MKNQKAKLTTPNSLFYMHKSPKRGMKIPLSKVF